MAAHEILAVLLVAVPATLLLALLVIDRRRQLHRELASVPLRPTGALQEGMYRVEGRARRGSELLKAPISGRPCLAWHLVVIRIFEQEDDDGVALPGTQRVAIELRACADFWIEDDAGQAAVQPGHHFTLALAERHRMVRGTWSQLSAEVRREIERYHDARTAVIAAWDPQPAADARFAEAIIGEDEILSVGGEVHRELHPLGEAAPRAAPMRSTLRGTLHNPLIISDEVTLPRT